MNKLWIGHGFDDAELNEISRAVPAMRIVRPAIAQVSNLVAAGRDPQLADCEIAYGQPHVDDVIESMSLRWVGLSSAGYTRFDRPDLRAIARSRGLRITSASGVYADPCAQHALAMMLAQARQLAEATRAHISDRSWNYLPLRQASRVLDASSCVLLVGYGSIARRLAELLKSFGVQMLAFRRSVRGDENVRTLPIDQLDEHLARADHVVNILPASSETMRFFGASRFSHFRRDAVFYNIGRGDTVDQDALRTALEQDRLGAAWLDVTTPEPLPPDHPLWSTPRCHITPHTAGGFRGERRRQLDHFLANLARYLRQEPLEDLVIG
jgi:phosphoglycerate dehydrogenase-like enzyme